MLNYGDFHLFINSFWFGLKAFLKKVTATICRSKHQETKSKVKRINIFKCEGQVQGHRI